MSARQKFLADLASRRFDDSDSDGSSSFSSSSVDEESAASDAYDDEVDFDEIDDTSLADQLLKVTPPRNALPESDGAAYIERVKPLFREQSHSSNLRKQISVNYAESKPAPTKAELTPTISVIPQVPSSPLLRRAESFRRNKTQPNTPTRHMRSFSHDINERRMVNRPNLSKSVSMSSSFAEINDDLSAVTSVISTASINSALGVPISTSKKSSTVQPRREHLPRRPTSGGSNINAATSKNFVKRSDTEDTSTEATEVTSSFSASLSLSHSKSFESSTSKSSASKELERLKRLSIGGKKMDKNYAACDATEEGFELQVDFSKSDVSENSSDVSSIFWSSRGRQIDRTNKVSQISPATSGKKALNPGRMSLKDLKMKRYGGSESVASEHERSTGDDNRNSSSLMKSSSAKERSNSMPPLQSVLSRSKVPCERSKMSAPLEASISSSNLSRDERRRGRSITRSSDVIVPPSPPSLRSSSTPRPAPNSPLRRNSANALSRTPPRCTSNRNRDASPALPTNVLASRTTRPKTPPRMKACSDIPPPSPSSPSMNSRHKYRSGFQSSHEGARHRSPSPGPKRESIFQVLKPSKLASLSISVLSKAALPIQSLARSYIAKLRIENRRKNIVVMQSLIRRWICVRYYKSARTIALKCQGVYRGMIARDQLDFRHYCATRIQAVCRGFLGTLLQLWLHCYSSSSHLTPVSSPCSSIRLNCIHRYPEEHHPHPKSIAHALPQEEIFGFHQ